MELKTILQDMRKGSLELLFQNMSLIGWYTETLLSCAKNNKQLLMNEQSDLETLIRIGNIIYNQTDMECNPISDGAYDLLLEYYKTYNLNFQVGSEVISFPSCQHRQAPIHDLHCPVKIMTEEEMNHDKEFFYDNLKVQSYFDMRDGFYKCPVTYIGDIGQRTRNTKHNHPDLVGTLDKCKFVLSVDAEKRGVLDDSNVKVLERDFFANHIKEGIISPDEVLEMIVELKYDGISVEADCKNMVLSARTRGDTGVELAADLTPMLEGYVFPHSHEAMNEIKHPIGLKFEAIMQRGALARYNSIRQFNYKNCRTAIIGLFGSNDAAQFRDFITLVPLELDRANIPNVEWNRALEIGFLNKYFSSKGCPLRHAYIRGTYRECLYYIKEFLKEAEDARDYLEFMYDGIVVSYLDENIRKKLGRVNHINKYSMAVKFNPLKKRTILTGIDFTVGQNGQITPMYHYNPVEFYGSTHMKTTGNSYARFNELSLAIGDIVEIEYVNDVIPRISYVECKENIDNRILNRPVPFISNCPICGSGLRILDSGKTVICPNNECPGRIVSRMVNMISKLNLKDFAGASIEALNVTNLTDLLNLKYEDVKDILGEVNGAKIIERINSLKTKPIHDYTIVGSLGFSGIGSRVWKSMLEKYTLEEIYCLYKAQGLPVLESIKGIGFKTVQTIYTEMPFFERDIQTILTMDNVVQTYGSKPSGPSIRATGFRDKELFSKLRDLGYDADDNASVTKTTDILLVPYSGFTSSKVKKVSENTKVMTKEEFLKEYKISL